MLFLINIQLKTEQLVYIYYALHDIQLTHSSFQICDVAEGSISGCILQASKYLIKNNKFKFNWLHPF